MLVSNWISCGFLSRACDDFAQCVHLIGWGNRVIMCHPLKCLTKRWMYVVYHHYCDMINRRCLAVFVMSLHRKCGFVIVAVSIWAHFPKHFGLVMTKDEQMMNSLTMENSIFVLFRGFRCLKAFKKTPCTKATDCKRFAPDKNILNEKSHLFWQYRQFSTKSDLKTAFSLTVWIKLIIRYMVVDW